MRSLLLEKISSDEHTEKNAVASTVYSTQEHLSKTVCKFSHVTACD